MADPLHFYTPMIGRFVSGSLTEKRSKDGEGRPIAPDNQRFEFGIAFDKQQAWAFLGEKFYPYLASALSVDQNGLQRMSNWFQNPAAKGIFSMKITDGDAPNQKGHVSDHTKGMFVFWFSAIDLKTVDPNNLDLSPDMIKRGWFVQVAGSIKPNEQQGDRAGIYMNGNIVRLVAEGDVIVGGIDPTEAFGGTTAATPAALPPGARPLGSSSGVAAGFAPAGGSMAPVGQFAGAPPAGIPIASPGSPPAAPYAGAMQFPAKLPGM